MNLDNQLHEELRLVAGSAHPSPPDIAGLIEAGSAHRARVRRTRAVAALAAAAVVVTGVILAPRLLDIGGGDRLEPTRAPTFEEMPVGVSTKLPWLKDGVLHVDGETIEVAEPAGVFYSAGTTVVQGEDRIWLVDGDRLVLLRGTSAGHKPVLSADGQHVAVAETTRGRTQISWYSGELVSTKEVDGGLNDVRVQAVLPDGRVVYVAGRQGKEFVWSPEFETTVARPPGAGTLTGSQWPGGVSVNDQYGTLGGRGRFHAVGSRPGSIRPWTNDLWDPRGIRILDEDFVPDPSGGDRQVYRVAGIEPGRSVELLLPLSIDFRPVAWETDDHVILAAPGTSGTLMRGLVRRDVETGGCERVAGVPRDSEVPSQ